MLSCCKKINNNNDNEQLASDFFFTKEAVFLHTVGLNVWIIFACCYFRGPRAFGWGCRCIGGDGSEVYLHLSTRTVFFVSCKFLSFQVHISMISLFRGGKI